MFVNFNPDWPPQPEAPPPPRPHVDARGRRLFVAAIAFNLVMLVLAPLAGVTLFQALAALLG